MRGVHAVAVTSCLLFTCITTAFAQMASETGNPSSPFVKGTTNSGGSPGTWTKNWSAFVKQIALVSPKPGESFARSANIVFHGSRVTWTGKVTQIDQPQEAGKSGRIGFSMNTETLALQDSGKVGFLDLQLRPEGDEWKTWGSVSVGDTVSFATTLDKGETYVLSFFKFFNQPEPLGSGEFILVHTKGGSCLKIVAPAKK